MDTSLDIDLIILIHGDRRFLYAEFFRKFFLRHLHQDSLFSYPFSECLLHTVTDYCETLISRSAKRADYNTPRSGQLTENLSIQLCFLRRKKIFHIPLHHTSNLCWSSKLWRTSCHYRKTYRRIKTQPGLNPAGFSHSKYSPKILFLPMYRCHHWSIHT